MLNPEDDVYLYLRARALTFLRHRLNDVCHVRLCLGGHEPARKAGTQGSLKRRSLLYEETNLSTLPASSVVPRYK